MCEICQDAKNKWFRRIIKGWNDTSVKEVQEACDRAFGEDQFEKAMYPDSTINWQGRVECKHCGEKYHIRSV